MQKLFGIETKRTIVPISATHNGEHWDVQLDPVYGFCIYMINPKRSIEFVKIDIEALKKEQNTSVSIITNMTIYNINIVFVGHVLDNESNRIIIAKLLHNETPVGHVYSLAKTSIVLDVIDHNAISIVV
jgi:hypothetical protein